MSAFMYCNARYLHLCGAKPRNDGRSSANKRQLNKTQNALWSWRREITGLPEQKRLSAQKSNSKLRLKTG